ncbi:C4-dicarboxylate TRAP transporter substrate-binding protein [Treponema sp. Marseille-Q4523]|uniref:C4-dicarboxylate TRAP transporter substrate-binding protein n=1 Tax=Treponema sp. Marseille-Q4523 TaxID=2810610 RepID=UPI001961EAE0|nr:C4-dicarboxylate TRAP transporter substrate-binding protein [Treponema sp. Marseille-Q4523]MBM7022114.1 C4-dicarboxylate TRAP transporter substrate-binding protein [Treponema sp. Marseille-Q4523]
MKRVIVLLAAVILMISSIAVAMGTQDTINGTKTIALSIAHDNHPGDPLTEACNYWATILKERSNGTMILTCYPSGQLGSKNDLIDQMLAGDPIMVVVNGPFAADRGVNDIGIIQAPYLFENWEQLDKLMASSWGQEQKRRMANIGLQVIADNWRYGVRHTLTTKKVVHPSDLKGMKIRTQGSTIHIEGFRCLGATPTPMTLSEVYTSLQQGVVNGLENPLSVLYSGKFQEVAKYLALDAHIYDLSFVCISSNVFEKLTPTQQKLLIETGLEAGTKQNELAVKADAECLQKLKKEGVTVSEVSFKEFQTAASSFYMNKDITGKWTPGLIDTVTNIINK